MNFSTLSTPCPCESGLEFDKCCGNPQQENIMVTTLDAHGIPDRPITPELQIAIDNINQAPDLLPTQINPFTNSVDLVKMSPFWYSESIFLDVQRIASKCHITANLRWFKKISDEHSALETPYIFHTAFCGSTIVSRALELSYHCLALREPDILFFLVNQLRSGSANTVQEAQWYNRIANMLSRRFDKHSPAVIKANDYANPIITRLLHYRPETKALLMYLPVDEFTLSCLKSESRIQWIKERYRLFLNTIQTFFTLPKDVSSPGTIAGIYWAFNILLYTKSLEQWPYNLKTLEFNAFLQDPANKLKACAEWFNLEENNETTVDNELAYLLGEYSKAPGSYYTPETRQEEISRLKKEYAHELLEAESIARQLLGADYPETDLPNAIVSVRK